MSNHAKNLFVGTGGKEAIDKSHFAGACYGMEKIMGRTDTPVRALFDEGARRFARCLPPVFYVLGVVDPPGALRGIYAGFDRECFAAAAAYARKLNITLLDEPIKKALVYLEAAGFSSAWLGNKAIYRTRMAMAPGGELSILAPGVERFGEDPEADKLIRKYGYRPACEVLELVKSESDLAENLSVAAHLIHGSSEGKFKVRYNTSPRLSRSEIEQAGFQWGSLDDALSRYDPKKLKPGWNTDIDGEPFFFVSNPALGLWAEKSRFGG
jgi:hypothetical protein